MSIVITVLHVLVCIFLVAVVLLQQGKGAQVGAVFGGGGGTTMFGGRGAGNFLTKLTTGAAIIYMVTSMSLSYLGITAGGERLFEDGAIEEEQPAPEKEKPLYEDLGAVPLEKEGGAAAGKAESGAATEPEGGQPAP